MIELVNASKYYPTRFGRHYIFRNVTLALPAHLNIGIIGANGAGKSTLMRLLAGVDQPSEGKIVRTGKISWPLGLVPSVLGSLTGRENARFVLRIYGLSGREIDKRLVEIARTADIGTYFDMPVRTYSSGMRSRLNFATSMAIEFDYYLFDEVGAPGDRAFKKISKVMVDERLAKSRFILTSHNPKDLLDLCQAAILLGDGKLRYFDDVREALREYGEDIDELALKRRARRPRLAPAQPGATAAVPPVGPPDPQTQAARVLARQKRQRTAKLRQTAMASGLSDAPPHHDPAAAVPPLAVRPRGPMAAPAAGEKPPRRAMPLRRPAAKDGPRAQ